MSLTIDTFVTGPLQVNTYLLRCDDDAVVVDPGSFTQDAFRRFLQAEAVQPDAIWLTHAHGDHIAGVAAVKQQFPAVTIVCPKADAALMTDADMNLSRPLGLPIAAPPADHLIAVGDVLHIGSSEWTVLDTSGHTAGGVSYHCPGAGIVLTGDSLFAGGIGRTDIPGGDATALLANIERHLMSLPDETQVLPGHGPATTIGRERQGNPFLL